MDLDLCWRPHSGQEPVKNALFNEGKKLIFIECGRKFGKTEILCYLLFRYALSNPNSACYFIAPFQKQAREIVWANGRLQNFFKPIVDPKTRLTHRGHTESQAFQILEELNIKYGVRIKDQEMRIVFGNGSFIKLDGADNHQAYRGVSPHLIAYDEFKDHHPKFHTGMDPNLAAFDAPLIAVGTPCEGDENNKEGFEGLADYSDIAEHGLYLHAPTHSNPYISKDFLKRKKAELFAKGEEDKWYREYEAKRIKAGARNIFPMFENADDETPITRHVKDDKVILAEVRGRRRDFDFFMSFDPASSTTFSVVLAAIHKYSKQVYILDEIYAQGRGETSTGQVFPQALAMLDRYSLMYDEVRMIYDNAATWFANEVADRYGYGLEPCRKDVNKKEDRLSLMKDMFLEDFLVFSDRCVKSRWEFANYRVDENGRIPKEDDHSIDNVRYILSNAFYNSLPVRVENPDNLDERRYYTYDNDSTCNKSGLEGLDDKIYQEYYQ